MIGAMLGPMGADEPAVSRTGATALIERVRHEMRRRGRRPERYREPHVHFHQGPQGQPVPCFDERCTSPHLTA